MAYGDEQRAITGESGTGKELVARALHEAGEKEHAPFIAVNCAGIDPSTLYRRMKELEM